MKPEIREIVLMENQTNHFRGCRIDRCMGPGWISTMRYTELDPQTSTILYCLCTTFVFRVQIRNRYSIVQYAACSFRGRCKGHVNFSVFWHEKGAGFWNAASCKMPLDVQ
jgi:hypothetical protein